MRIMVFGAGAIGQVFGGMLSEKGADITLIARPTQAAAIRDNGLTIDGIWGKHQATDIACYSNPESIEGLFDVILLCVKSFDTVGATKIASPFLKPDGMMISVQNGLGNIESIAKTAGENRTAGARVIFGSQLTNPGRPRVTVYAQPVLIGSPFVNVNSPLLAALVETIAHAGIPCESSRNILADIWGKALYNCALNPLGAVLRTEYGKLADQQDTRDLMNTLLRECFLVADARKVSLPWKNPEEYQQLFYTKLVPSTYAHKSSMLQDIQKGKKTEIDHMNGIICDYANENGISTPANRTMVNLIHFLESVPS